MAVGNRDVGTTQIQRGEKTCSRSLEMPSEQKQIGGSICLCAGAAKERTGREVGGEVRRGGRREPGGRRGVLLREKKLAGVIRRVGGTTLARRVQGVCAEHNTRQGLSCTKLLRWKQSASNGASHGVGRNTWLVCYGLLSDLVRQNNTPRGGRCLVFRRICTAAVLLQLRAAG